MTRLVRPFFVLCLLLGPLAPGARAAELLSGTVSVGITEDVVPKGVGQRFPEDQRELHAVVDLNGVKTGTTIKGAWVAVDAVSEPDYVIATTDIPIEADGFTRAHLQISLAEGRTWPPGNYAVVLSLDGEEFGRVPFSIAPRDGDPPPWFTTLGLARALTANGRPEAFADEFDTEVETIFGLAMIENLNPGVRIRGVWSSAAAGGVLGETTVTIESAGTNLLRFRAGRPEGGWPQGWYRFEVYAGDQRLAWAPFFVYPDRQAAQSAPAPTADAPEGPEAPPAAGAEWTVLVYLDGDNNLEPFALKDLEEMERALPAKGVEVLVLLDRAQGYTDAEGDWTGARLLRVRRAPEAGIQSKVLADLGEVNMGDPAVLRAFLAKGFGLAPSKRRALLLWDHGGGWASHVSDEQAPGVDSGEDHLTLPELRRAIEAGLRDVGVARLDLVGFDMCLMAQIETAYELRDVADVMVASEAVEPGDGWPYDTVLPLFGRPGRSPRQVAADIVDAFDAYYLARNEAVTTLSALDLREIGGTVEALDALLGRIGSTLGENWPAFTRTLFFSEGYASLGDVRKGKKGLLSVDLGNAFANLARLTPAVGSLPEYAGFEAALRRVVIRSRTSSRHRNSRGVAVYAPFRADLLNDAYVATRFGTETRWVPTLRALYAAQRENPARIRLGGIRTISLLRNQPVGEVLHLGQDGFEFTFEGTNLLYAYAMIGERDDARGRTLLFRKSLLRKASPGDEGGAVPKRGRAELLQVYTYPDGRHDLRFRYDGIRHLLANGEAALPVTLDETDIGNTVAHVMTVPVQYVDPKYGEFFATVYYDWLWRPASMVVEVPRKDGTVVYAEVDPPPEARIRPLLETVDDRGGVSYTPTGEMAWRDGPSLTIDLVPPGPYEVLLALESLTGRSNTGRHTFRVAERGDDLLANRESAAEELTAENLEGEWELIDPNAWFQARRMVPLGGFVTYRPHPRLKGVLKKIVSRPRGQDLYRGLDVVTVIQRQGLPHLRQYVLDERGSPRFDYGYAMTYPVFDQVNGRGVMLAMDLLNGELQVFVKRSGPALRLRSAPASVPAGQPPGPAGTAPGAGAVSLDGVWQSAEGTGLVIQGTQWVYYEFGQPVDQGVLRVQGDTIEAQSLVTGTTMVFRFRLGAAELILQDEMGGVTRYARAR